jgi:hypothetical protein
MFRLDLICLTNSGISAARTVRVRPMIESTQVEPPSGSICRISVSAQCQATRTAEMA